MLTHFESQAKLIKQCQEKISYFETLNQPALVPSDSAEYMHIDRINEIMTPLSKTWFEQSKKMTEDVLENRVHVDRSRARSRDNLQSGSTNRGFTNGKDRRESDHGYTRRRSRSPVTRR